MPTSYPTPSNSPPASNEVEVSLFGTGVGESIVAHLGGNHWVVVDSCIDPSTNLPIAEAYLKSLGLNPCECIDLIVVTHWHGDHIAGISSLVKKCVNAIVSIPDAMLSEEFTSLLSALNGKDNVFTHSKSLVEMQKTIKNLVDNPKQIPARLKKAAENKILFEKISGSHAIQVRSLSPSDLSVTESLAGIERLIPKPGTEKREIVSRGQNHNAVVLWMSIGGLDVLLGSDLETLNNPHSGWASIVSLRKAAGHTDKAQLFKIPHHGSVTGHDRNVWTDLVAVDATSFMTTYSRGAKFLPSTADIARIKGFTPNVYCTTLPGASPTNRKRAVDKMVNGIVKSRKVLTGEVGHIQIRVKPSGSPGVALSSRSIKC